MNKMKYLLPFVVALFLYSPCVMAQEVDYEKEFDNFQQQQQKEFTNFKNKADADFETFLRETWTKYEAYDPVPAPVRPEPVEPILYETPKPMIPTMPPVKIKPAAPKVPAQPYAPVVKIELPVVPPNRIVNRMPVEFYGTTVEVAIDAIEGFGLTGNRERDVADGWSKLCKANHEQLIKDCMILRTEKNLNDWGYLLFTQRIGQQLFGADHTDDIAFLQMFILTKSGYKVRLSKINEKLKLMVSPASSLYGIPYILLDGLKYYVFDAEKGNAPMGVYTYKHDFANAKNFVRLDISTIPHLQDEEFSETVSPKSGSLKVETSVNKNLIAFYKDYPQCDVAVYYKTPMSEGLKAALLPALKASVAGKTAQDAAGILLEFVQTGFEYQTDGEQFGYEKPFFLDENFYYPACDCEDRAILYSTLVKELLGLDAILLDYPNHIASAVRFDEAIPGDYIVLDDGTKYLICDPTYIGAPIGKCMDQFREISPEIIR